MTALLACFTTANMLGVGKRGRKSCRESWYIRTFIDIFRANSMCTYQNRPDELIEHIVLSSFAALDTVDIVALSSTCHRLRTVLLRSAAVWKTLFSTTFAEISRSVEKLVETMAQNGDDDLHSLWQKLFVSRFLAGKVVRQEVGKLSKKFFHRQDLSNLDMVHFVDLIPKFDEQSKDLEDLQHTKVKKYTQPNLCDYFVNIHAHH